MLTSRYNQGSVKESVALETCWTGPSASSVAPSLPASCLLVFSVMAAFRRGPADLLNTGAAEGAAGSGRPVLTSHV